MTQNTHQTIATDVNWKFLQDISLWNVLGNNKVVNQLKVIVNQHHADQSVKRSPPINPILLIGSKGSGRTVLAHAYSNSLGCDHCFTAGGSSMGMGGRDIVDFLKQGTGFSSFFISHAESLPSYCINVISTVLKNGILQTREIPGYRKAMIQAFNNLIIFSATDITQLDAELLSNVNLHFYLDEYSCDEIFGILKQRTGYLNWQVENNNVLKNIAEVSFETVSLAIKILAWTYRCARSNDEDVLTAKHLNQALHLIK